MQYLTDLAPESQALDSWKVLIADDDQIIHDVTALALKGFLFHNKPLSLYHAYSGIEVGEMLRQNPDMAVALLDVVMETDDAGLQAARYIREELNNPFVRIIIRTGLPDAAPEESIIRDYDINDYKSKNELTIQKLKTSMYTSLRMYRDLINLDKQRKVLRRLIDSSSNLFEHTQIEEFISDIRIQIAKVLRMDRSKLLDNTKHTFLLAACNKGLSDCLPQVLCGNGRFASSTGQSIDIVLELEDMNIIRNAITKKKTVIEDGKAVFISTNAQGNYGLIYFAEIEHLSSSNFDLMQLFSRNISIAYNNFCFQPG
jgi:CheY-like chemotaxis protein